MRLILALLVPLTVVGCDTGVAPLNTLDDDTTSDIDTSEVGDPEVVEDPGSEVEPDTDPPPPPVRFVALGDAGDNPTHQAGVAAAMATTCAARGCDFALYLGDNFYDTGLSGFTDPRFQSNFEVPYASLDFPFYAVLGNHDLGGDGLGLDWDQDKANYQVDYTAQSTRWTMPSEYYAMNDTEPYVRSGAVPHEVVTLIGLDTTRMFFGNSLGTLDTQAQWLVAELAANTSPWVVGFGHHPYISNGRHGNAGIYEGLTEYLDFIPLNEEARGGHVKSLFDTTACGGFDVYFSGHDHNRQILPPPPGCDTLFVVTGAGAKNTDFHNDPLRPDNPVTFADDQERGFVWAEIDGDSMTLYVVDEDGDEHGPFVHLR